MPVSATDISLIFLGILIVMVLLEVRKLSRKPEPVSRLEQQFERLSEQMERIAAPQDIKLPGGAQIVEAGQAFETISEQLERLGESTGDLGVGGEAEIRAFLESVQALRADLRSAQELFERTATGLGASSDSLLAAGSALQRIEARLESVVASAGRPEDGRGGASGTTADAASDRDPAGGA